MEKRDFTRRDFIKTSAIGATAILAGCGVANGLGGPYDAKGLPTTVLGKTGVTVPRIAIGCGSRFLMASTDEGIEMMHYALDNGLYYWDTAHSYINNQTKEASEERLGRILKDRRKEVFLATKLDSRDPDGFKRQFETSLQRLQTDHVDLLNMHSINSLEDAKNLAPVIKVIESYKEQGFTRFAGFTGHTTAEGMTYAAKTYGLDFMLIALNHYHQDRSQNMEKMAIPAAAANSMGVMVMKVIRPRENVPSLAPDQLIRYGLSLQQVNGTVISMQTLDLMKQNIALLKSFKPMTATEMDSMAMALEPFYRSQDLEWQRPGYRDGVWG